jgi:hypothetical protein
MKYLLINIFILSFLLFISCKRNQKSEIVKKNASNSHQITDKIEKQYIYIAIDSERISLDTYDYILLYIEHGKRKEVYRLRNQDYSIVFKKNYEYQPLNYICYEVSDLPTGSTWEILYDRKSKSFFITDHFDLQAIGDTLDRTSVNFKEKYATVVSTCNKKTYNIKLKNLIYK